MATTNSYTSPQVTGANVEDLDNIAYDISPTETPFMTMAGRGKKPMGVNFDWITRALASPSANGVVEGKALTETAATAPTRLKNTTQIQLREVTITGTQQAVDSVDNWGHVDEETARKLAEIKRDIEAACLRMQPVVYGDASTARQTRSFGHFIPQANVLGYTVPSGEDQAVGSFSGAVTTLTMDNFRSLMKACYDVGARPKKVFLDSVNKQLVSAFTGRVNTVLDASQKQVTFDVTLVETDFGRLEIVVDQFFPSGATKSDFTYFVDPEYVELRFLRPFRKTPMGKVGDKDTWQIIAEWGLQVHNPSAHGVIGYDAVP